MGMSTYLYAGRAVKSYCCHAAAMGRRALGKLVVALINMQASIQEKSVL
jgi:hypothetical protein